MRISTQHRAETKRYPPSVYHEVARLLVPPLADAGVSSVILCGSTVKNDIVPSWSDLDVIVISNNEWITEQELAAARRAIAIASSRASIGVGIDLGPRRLLAAEGRIGGRPLAMTYEVAAYGSPLLGDNDLRAAPRLESQIETIIQESWPALLAEIHNWHRLYCASLPGPAAFLRDSVKTWLKILKHLVEPYTVPPYTHASYLRILRDRANDAPHLVSILDAAVQARSSFANEDWSEPSKAKVAQVLAAGFTDTVIMNEIVETHASRC